MASTPSPSAPRSRAPSPSAETAEPLSSVERPSLPTPENNGPNPGSSDERTPGHGPSATASSKSSQRNHNDISPDSDSGSIGSSIPSQHSPGSSHQVNVLRADDEEPTTASRRTSRTSSRRTLSRASSRVPVSQRRGLFPYLTLVPEYYDARDYPNKVKYLLVFVVAAAAITGPMGTSIMLPAIDDIVKELHTSASVVNISVGIYLLSLGIFPIWWSAFSEKHGRRSVYIISYVLFLAFLVGNALAPNIAALIILRFLAASSGASAVQSVGAGTIGDLFAAHERGVAMGFYYLGPLLGPFLSPIMGGAVSQAWGWRATQYTMIIFCGVNLLLIVFVLPETLRRDEINIIKDRIDQKLQLHESVNDAEAKRYEETAHEHEPYTEADLDRIASNMSQLSSHRRHNLLEEDDETPAMDTVMPMLSRLATNRSNYSRKQQHETFYKELDKLNTSNEKLEAEKSHESSKPPSYGVKVRTFLHEYFIRPTYSIILLTYPPVALIITYSAICFACIYFFNMTISSEYAASPYNFSNIIIGLMYIPNSVTYVIASVIGGRWNDHLLMKYAKSHNGDLCPESRISWNVVVAVLLSPPACLIFGWCFDFGEHWVTPLIGTALFGFASMLIIGCTVTYLVDLLPGKGATGVALNNLVRQILAAIATFIVDPLLSAIGPGILFSILMGIMLVASSALYYLKKKGAFFREHYDLSAYYDRL